jgi:apolipoprotein N-acyltransferase
MIFAVPFALFWSDTKPLTIRAPLLLVTLLLPPFGIFGMGHPVLAAGALFPATGLFGIALVIGLSPVYVTSYCWCGLLLSAALICMHGGLQPLTDVSILAIDTDFDSKANKTTHNLTTDWLRPAQLRARLLGGAPTAAIIVLPEEIAGVFTPEILNRWSTLARETNKVILVGGDQLLSTIPSNTIVRFDTERSEILYTQRQPVPFTMWKPWSAIGYPISFLGPSVAKVRGKKLGFLLCYELLTPWTVIQTAAQHPDVIVGATNISYARNTNLYPLMELHRNLWGALFGLPFIVAHNR